MSFAVNKDKIAKMILLAIIVGATILRLYKLSFQSFWLDEVLNINWSQLPSVSAILDFLKTGDTSPPFYYLFMHFWLKLGSGEFIARLPSAISGVLTVFCVFKVAESMLGRKIGLLASALVAVSPFYLWVSQEARMYSFLGLFSVSSLYFLIDAIKRNKRLSWLGYFIFSVLAFYTHYYAIFTIFAEFLFFVVVVSKNKKVVLEYLLSSSAVVLSLLPLCQFFQEQMVNSPRKALGLYPPTIWSIPHAFFDFSTGYSLLRVELTTFFQNLLYNILLIISIALFFAPIFIAGLSYLVTKVKKANLVLFYFFVPLVGSYLISLKVHIFGSKYLVAAASCYYIILALGLFYFRRGLALVVLAGVLLIDTIAIHNYYFNDKFSKAPWREFVKFAEKEERQGDAYIFTLPFLSDPFEYYYRGKMPRYAALDKIGSLMPGLDSLLKKYKRVWFVPDIQGVFDSQDSVRKYLNTNARLEAEYEIRGMKFSLFRLVN